MVLVISDRDQGRCLCPASIYLLLRLPRAAGVACGKRYTFHQIVNSHSNKSVLFFDYQLIITNSLPTGESAVLFSRSR